MAKASALLTEAADLLCDLQRRAPTVKEQCDLGALIIQLNALITSMSERQ